MTKPVLFFQQTYDELKKVHWPTRPEIIRLTIIVLLISAVVGLYIGAVDYLFVTLTELILR